MVKAFRVFEEGTKSRRLQKDVEKKTRTAIGSRDARKDLKDWRIYVHQNGCSKNITSAVKRKKIRLGYRSRVESTEGIETGGSTKSIYCAINFKKA